MQAYVVPRSGYVTDQLLKLNPKAGQSQKMLEIRDLHVSIDETEILKGISLTVNEGEVHAIMGPNGSGKSTLANVVAGRPEYTITSGEILYNGQNILGWFPEARAREGIFLAMQYPVELPGVRTWQFLKAAVDALRKHKGESALSVRQFDRLLDSKRELVQHRRRPRQTLGQRGVLRRREEA